MVKSTLLTATRPPKRLVMPRATRRSAMLKLRPHAAQRTIYEPFFTQLIVDRAHILIAVQLDGALAVGEDPLWSRQHQDHQRQAENADLVLRQPDRPEEWAQDRH